MHEGEHTYKTVYFCQNSQTVYFCVSLSASLQMLKKHLLMIYSCTCV